MTGGGTSGPFRAAAGAVACLAPHPLEGLAVEKRRSHHYVTLSFDDGFEALERDLLDLDRRIADLASQAPDVPILVSHPVYQYLARRYSLNVRSLHWEQDEMPDGKMWREVSDFSARYACPISKTRSRPDPTMICL